ncbi:MAG: glucose-6-phosphate dehydrogenase [Anaerolineae bacterium]|jgi:glucose-6-phosphate 1-dehydrogenase|nr:glucose-6-phosphate dehydrogenase [Anaerolineae bacterium]
MITSIVIFGASGDLAKRKLIPALYNLFAKERLKGDFCIVGVSRTAFSHEQFREDMGADCQRFEPAYYNEARWQAFAGHLYYITADASQVDGMRQVKDQLQAIEGGPCQRLYYLSVGPTLYEPIIGALREHGLQQEDGGWRRVVIEKPFGTDLASAQALNRFVHEAFEEYQIYRIDHYLGKETAQNLLFLRFANLIFEPVWNRNYIDNVQITVMETVDVGRRAGYYDGSGVMRDMFQNHLLQLLTLVAMEPPTSFEATPLRNEKVKVLRAVRPIDLKHTIRAQYDGYRNAEGVASDSITPTYAAIKLYIDNWRWQGVPFYLRSGKALKHKVSEIAIQFKRPPHSMFGQGIEQIAPNVLTLCIQPDEGIHLQFEAKTPDQPTMQPVDMEFHYRTSFKAQNIPEAYERLLLDALNGDAALFNRSDEIEAAWSIVDPVIQGWSATPDASPLVRYAKDSEGPSEAEHFLAESGRHD